MYNVIVANYNKDKSNSVKKYSLKTLELDLKAQIDNSLQLGWDVTNFLVLTNFDFEYLNIKSTQINLNKNCLTGSKLFAMREIFKLNMVDDNIWIHDLDAWQNDVFEFPDIEYCGLCEYSKPKFNGGSMFYTPKAKNIIFALCEYLEKNNQAREEPTLDKILRNEFKKETVILNSSYNVGCSGFKKRYDKAIKPIKVIHGHLGNNRLSWDTHVRGRNGPEYVSCSDRLKKLIINYYDDKIKTFKYEDDIGPYEKRIKEVDRILAKRMRL
jgi:hypothetical protein